MRSPILNPQSTSTYQPLRTGPSLRFWMTGLLRYSRGNAVKRPRVSRCLQTKFCPPLTRYHQRFIDKWGRTGFDGDSSGSWLHAELDVLVKQIEPFKRE